MTLVLASASPARLALLRDAGIAPRVMVSGVEEDGVQAPDARELACALAERKAEAVAARLSSPLPAAGSVVTSTERAPRPPRISADPVTRLQGTSADPIVGSQRTLADHVPGTGAQAGPAGRTLVLGCDSVLAVEGEVRGKPTTPAQARDWWRGYRDSHGTLVTGHAVVDLSTGRRVTRAAATLVRFGSPTDAEIDAYVATGEPLAVAGGFTLDGYCAPFVAGIEGDHGTVLGLSLPLLRTLLAELDVPITDLWARP